jgi:hypothetical protein
MDKSIITRTQLANKSDFAAAMKINLIVYKSARKKRLRVSRIRTTYVRAPELIIILIAKEFAQERCC